MLAGIATARPVRTSSVLLDFSRNSTDNAFYPTRGTRLTWNGELAGGPFLGAVNFIKHRAEGRVYLPSLLKARHHHGARRGSGCWASGRGSTVAVPHYERFRLGGGTRSTRCAATTTTWSCRTSSSRSSTAARSRASTRPDGVPDTSYTR